MNRAPMPLKQHLRQPEKEHVIQPEDEQAIQRIWRGVERRRAGMTVRRRAGWFGGAGLALAAAVVLLARPTRPVEPGPLRLLAGDEPTALEGTAGDSTVPLDDGSRVILAPAARATVVENSGHAFVVVLSVGRATFDVHPGGPRRWSIECGLATVEVVGTRFTVDRAPASVDISVERGTVLVRGERVPERLQRLVAGQSLRLGGGTPGDRPAAGDAERERRARPALPPPSPEAAAVAAPELAHPPVATPATWRELVRGSRYRQAYGTLGKRGIARTSETATPQELLWLADIARLSGHPDDAVLPLRRLIKEYPQDRNTPIALFTLGRIELDALGDNQAAADSFSRAIAVGVPRSLAEDAAARLVEARARAGDAAGARAAASRYLAAFPDGRHAADVRRWAAPP